MSDNLNADFRGQRWFAFCLMVASVLAPCYNGILALINAHALQTPKAAAVVAELAILALALAGCTLGGHRDGDKAPLGLMLIASIISLSMSLANDTIYPDLMRNIAIISCFTALGFRTSTTSLLLIFRIVSAIVALILLVEIYSIESYVWLFQPAKYLEASRNIQQFELNDTGLFANALGYRDRFNFGVFSGPRTSSIFLEQVSLPGYATVTLIFIVSKWNDLTRADRFLQISLILLIVLSNNSRTSAAMLVVMALGYFIYPHVNSRLSIVLPALCVGVAFFIVGPVETATGTDDLMGRLSVTVAALYNFDVGTYLSGSLSVAYRSFDSGYAYIIASSSIWGMISLFAYITFVPGAVTAEQRRSQWSLALYVYVWLLIGGTAVFTMKTAALLWLVVGHMAYFADQGEPTTGQATNRPVGRARAKLARASRHLSLR